MISQKLGIEYLIEVGVQYAESSVGNINSTTDAELRNIFSDFLTNKIIYSQCCQLVNNIIGSTECVSRLQEILDLPDEPLPHNSEKSSSPYNSQGSDSERSNYFYTDNVSNRKKTRTWTVKEDQRLLAAVFHFGTDNWQSVAAYLGSGRNRAQCAQRWARGLNPKISKKSWTPEEDEQLENLVKIHGNKSWTRIAAIMGNRSDVQCRYHYKQILSGNNSQSDEDFDDYDQPRGRSRLPLTRSSPGSKSLGQFQELDEPQKRKPKTQKVAKSIKTVKAATTSESPHHPSVQFNILNINQAKTTVGEIFQSNTVATTVNPFVERISLGTSLSTSMPVFNLGNAAAVPIASTVFTAIPAVQNIQQIPQLHTMVGNPHIGNQVMCSQSNATIVPPITVNSVVRNDLDSFLNHFK